MRVQFVEVVSPEIFHGLLIQRIHFVNGILFSLQQLLHILLCQRRESHGQQIRISTEILLLRLALLLDVIFVILVFSLFLFLLLIFKRICCSRSVSQSIGVVFRWPPSRKPVILQILNNFGFLAFCDSQLLIDHHQNESRLIRNLGQFVLHRAQQRFFSQRIRFQSGFIEFLQNILHLFVFLNFAIGVKQNHICARDGRRQFHVFQELVIQRAAEIDFLLGFARIACRGC
mmetsp:Transcript_3075/g.5192  ORF Transcript_3075/g.5192 Transcript_3075/m.5192 type:complete len:230 (-) Transcript_3075:841-1530(-)